MANVKNSANKLALNGTPVPVTESTKNRKSKLWAYILWLFGGFFGAHHLYLGRDDQALVWFTTFGGYFGAGWLRDIYRIPTYVAEANNDPEYIAWFKHQVRINRKPPFSTVRFLGSWLVSCLWGGSVYTAIPTDEVFGINFRHLIILVPFVIALGTWVVGNIGRERGSFCEPVVAAYVCYPTLYYVGDDMVWIPLMAMASCLAFDTFSKEWRFKPKKKPSTLKRLGIFTLVVLIYFSLWTSYFYFNATITGSDGEEIKISESIKHFFTSPIWMDLKASLEHTWRYAQHQGFWAMWKELIDLSDPRGEINAYKVLGLSQTASQSEVTAKWRTLSREHHPDKVKGTEEERRKAQEIFMEIQQAYEILSSAKNRRQRRNRKSS